MDGLGVRENILKMKGYGKLVGDWYLHAIKIAPYFFEQGLRKNTLSEIIGGAPPVITSGEREYSSVFLVLVTMDTNL